MMTQTVTVPLPPSTSPDDWARTVDRVPPAARRQSDWKGKTLPRGLFAKLSIGTVLVSGNVGASWDFVTLSLVLPDGSTWVLATSIGGAWAEELAPAARDWLALPPAARVARIAREFVAKTEARGVHDKRTREAVAVHRRWIAEFGGTPEAPEAKGGGETPSTPGAMIREARKRAGMSQLELAEALGIHQTRVSVIEAWKDGAGGRPSLEWFLQHADLWRQIGLGPELYAALLADSPGGVCPCCRRPL